MESRAHAEVPLIELTQQVRSGWCVVSIRGRADSETADELERALRAAVEGHAKVAADFGAVDYISSAGLRAILQAARAAQERQAEFAVCQLRGSVKKVFEVSGVHHVLRINGELPC
jgi:anti-sigma B factor antagonist